MASDDATYIGLVISVGISCLIVSLFVLFGKPIEIEPSPAQKMLTKQVFDTLEYYLENPMNLFISPYFLAFMGLVGLNIVRCTGLVDWIDEIRKKKSQTVSVINGSES